MSAVKDKVKTLLDQLPEDASIEDVQQSLYQLKIDELWNEEIERRITEIESGKIKTIPGDEVLLRLDGDLISFQKGLLYV